MSYNFKNLADIELLTEVPETANKIIEVDGSIKRVPNKEVSGGDSMIKTAWIRQIYSSVDQTAYSDIVPSYRFPFECVNMTYEEALGYLQNDEPLACFITSYHYGGSYAYKVNTYGTVVLNYEGNIVIHYLDPIDRDPTYIFWTSEGISTSNDKPSTPPQ